MNVDRARRIVNAVLDELEGRGGFDVINQVMDDVEVYREMYAALVGVVQAADASDADPSESRFFGGNEATS